MTVNNYTDEGLCSAALRSIGAGGINSITDPTTDIEATCADLFPLSRDTLLSAHEWNFNLVERELAANAEMTPALGYTNAFRLPPSMIAGPYAVYGDGSKRPVSDYLNAENHIHCDYSVVKILCRIVPPIASWPPYFYDLVMHDCGMRFAKPVMGDREIEAEMRIKTYGPAQLNGEGGLYAKAKLIDAKSQPIQSLFKNGDPLTSTRY